MPWTAIGQVSSVVTLLAFVAAAVMSVLNRRLRQRERLIELAQPEDRSTLVADVLDRLRVDTSGLTRQQRHDLAVEKLHQRRERFRLLVLYSVVVTLLAGALGAYALFLRSDTREFYRVRVAVLGPDQQPVEDSELTVSVPGEKKRIEGGWEIEIPAGRRPPDGKARLWLTSPKDYLSGEGNVLLGEERDGAVQVVLSRKEVDISGRVLRRDQSPVVGAQVFVVGYPDEAVVTGANGDFRLPAHAARGQSVRLRADLEGFKPLEQHHLAGHEATLVLEEPSP